MPALPRLWFFTDPARTPDPVAIAQRLPRGAAVVYRHFGAADRFDTARALVRVARRRGLLVLIGGDRALASAARADGVHLPERDARDAATLKRFHPRWLVTAAAHSTAALRAARDADAAVLSPVFESRSASAGQPLGLPRAARMARAAPVPVIALGGVTHARVDMLLRRGVAGAAGIEMFLD
jgi:thiamine-phosphate pyrophosphorylase